MDKKPSVISRLTGYVATTFSILLSLTQWWLQTKGIITQANADITLYTAIPILIFGLIYIFKWVDEYWIQFAIWKGPIEENKNLSDLDVPSQRLFIGIPPR